MLQASAHRHVDLIFLSGCDNDSMDSMEEHRKAVGARIAGLREDVGLSQPALARMAGIKQPSLWAIENGETKEITARTLISLCRALGTTVEYVWDGSEGEEDEAEREAELVAIYRQLQPAGRLAVMQSARTVLAAMPAPTEPTPEELALFQAAHQRKVKPAQRRKRA